MRVEKGREREEAKEEGEEGRFLRSAELFSSWLLARCSVGIPLGWGRRPSNGFSSCIGWGKG